MSDLISNLYDLYEEYEILCNDLNIEPLDFENPKWYKHFNELEDVSDKINNK